MDQTTYSLWKFHKKKDKQRKMNVRNGSNHREASRQKNKEMQARIAQKERESQEQGEILPLMEELIQKEAKAQEKAMLNEYC